MTHLSDEKLMAYVDSELNSHESEEIYKSLQSDSEARERIEMFRESTRILREVYDAPIHEKVPQGLIDTIQEARAEEEPGAGFAATILSWLQISSWQPVHALAFPLILLLGVCTGWFTAGLSTSEQNLYSPIFEGSDFSLGMESTVSGMSFTVEHQHASVTPTTTFVGTYGHFCRQYEVAHMENGKSLPSQGVACRTNTGKWLTRVSILPESPYFDSAEIKNSYIPADDNELAAKIFSSLMAEPPLTIRQEEALIKNGWDTQK